MRLITTLLRHSLLTASLIVMTFSCLAQNIVPNPSFEIFTNCPWGFGQGGPLLCTPWENGSAATSDFFQICSTSPDVDVPTNWFGTQTPLTGDAYTGVIVKWPNLLWREYIQVQLDEPMEAGTLYDVSYYISCADNFCGSQNMGVYLSQSPPPSGGVGPLPVTPQLEADLGYLSDKINWTLIAGCYVAEGGEQYITIGNFYDDAGTPLDPDCGGGQTSYYYIEDVSVISLEESTLPLDLGEDVVACIEYEIDPDVTGVNYFWSDGSNGPTLTVTETGTYVLTITQDCTQGIDSIYVFFDGVPFDVDLGPEEIDLCNGDTYQISLDPDDGDYVWQDGSTGPDYTITTGGVYEVSMNDGCDISTDMIVVNLFDVPFFTLGDDVTLCTGDEIEFYFDPDLGEFHWQDNSFYAEYFITTGGLYELTITNMCGDFSDDLVVTEIFPPELDLGPDVSICAGDNIEILLEDETGDFVWENGSTSFYRFINSPGIYSVTVTNECFSTIDSIEVSFGDAPSFSLPADQQLCSGQTLLLDGNGAVGNYLWQDGSTGPDYLVSSEGTYSLTVTTSCGSASDSIFVSYAFPLASPDLGEDVSLCPGEEYIFYANIPGVNYTWQNGSTADSLIVNSAGTYWLQISDQCSSASDTVNVAINDNPPVVDLPSSLPLCNNAFLTLDANVSGVSYLWNDGSQGPSIIIGSPGVYSITVSNTCGSDVDTINILDAGPPPFVDLGNDIDICNGDIVNLSPVFSDVNTWLWQDGSTSQTYNITQAGSISVLVSNNCGDFTDSLFVSVLPDIPPIDLGADTSLCPGESFALSIDPNGVNILWSDGSTLPDLQVASSGLIYATITNQCGSASDSIVVSALAGIPPLDLGSDQSLCPGEVITLSPGIANVNYLWGNGSTSNTYNATTAGEISLTITNECGTRSDTIIVVENLEGPQVNLGDDILACAGDVITLSSDISGVDFLWQDGSTLPDLTTTTSGTFILEVSNLCGQDQDTVIVDINGNVPTPDLGPDTLLCDGATLQLISQADAITTIQWQNGSAQAVFTVTSPGEFILNESNHCGDVSDTINVAFLSAPPLVDLGPDQMLCPGETVTLTVPATTATITWQDGSHASTFLADQSQVYTVALTNECGTTGDDFELTIDQRTPLIDLQDEYPWCPENTFSLNVTQSFAAEYLWNDGSVLPTLQITAPGLYSVMVLTDCKTVEHHLEVLESDTCIIKNDVYVPNVFTPNADDRNDFFEVVFGPDLDVTSVKCSIYDRWGNLVYGTNTEPIRWDGSFYNKQLNQAVFTYLIHIKYLTHGQERTRVLSGNVTLVR